MKLNKFKYLAKSKVFYETNIQPQYGPSRGVHLKEVVELQEKMGVKFPLAFVEYLLWAGSENPVYLGSDAFYRHIFENKPILDEILEDNDIKLEHPSAPVVSLTHQGYIATWFYCDKGVEDPICYGFSESENDLPVCKEQSFSELVYQNMVEFTKLN